MPSCAGYSASADNCTLVHRIKPRYRFSQYACKTLTCLLHFYVFLTHACTCCIQFCYLFFLQFRYMPSQHA